MAKGTTDKAFIAKCLAVLEGRVLAPDTAGNYFENQDNRDTHNGHEHDVGNVGCGQKSALIFLHGLGPAMSQFCKLFAGQAVGLDSRRNVLRCPAAPKDPVSIIPPTFVARGVINSWFNFWCLPSMSVKSPFPCEDKKQLDRALGWVEEEIEDVIQKEGVCSENIVVAGMSQGGALTIWTALYSKYKLGGFVPIVTWLPLRNQYPVENIKNIVNRNTPIFHLNGMFDPIVSVEPAGTETKKELSKVFPNYEQINRPGTHLTTFNPLTAVEIKRWGRENTKLQFSSGGLPIPLPLPQLPFQLPVPKLPALPKLPFLAGGGGGGNFLGFGL